MSEYSNPDSHFIEDPIVFAIVALVLVVVYLWSNRTRL